MIQRYSIYEDGLTGCVQDEDDGGMWVKWKDVELMIERLTEFAANPCLASDANGASLENILAGRDRDDDNYPEDTK